MIPFSAASSDHVGIAAMTAQALPQPGLLSVERLLALRLPVRSPAARRDVVLRRVAADPELSREIRLAPHLSSLSRSIAETSSGSSKNPL